MRQRLGMTATRRGNPARAGERLGPRRFATHLADLGGRRKLDVALLSRGLQARPTAVLPVVAAGALAVGAVAIGALAVGSVAIGRLRLKVAHIERLVVDELTVERLHHAERAAESGDEPLPEDASP